MQIQLTTTGARSGEPRPITLYAWEDGERLVIVASKGGSVRNPAWVHNLRATPRATMTHGRASIDMAATEVTDPDERARLWRLVVGRFPLYATYQGRTERQIPLFVLEKTRPD